MAEKEEKKRKSRGRKPVIKSTALKDKLMKALFDSGGLKAVAARKLGISQGTLNKHIDMFPEIGEMLEELKEFVLDKCESNILKAIMEGDIETSKYYLSIFGGKRGWTQRQLFEEGHNLRVTVRVDMSEKEIKEQKSEALKEYLKRVKKVG